MSPDNVAELICNTILSQQDNLYVQQLTFTSILWIKNKEKPLIELWIKHSEWFGSPFNEKVSIVTQQPQQTPNLPPETNMTFRSLLALIVTYFILGCTLMSITMIETSNSSNSNDGSKDCIRGNKIYCSSTIKVVKWLPTICMFKFLHDIPIAVLL